MKKHLIITLLFFISILYSQAQDDLLELLGADSTLTDYAIGTFKGTRVINGHSIETPGKGELIFLISHRFGKINDGAYEFFGLDQSTIRLGLDYGISKRFTIGIGRNSLEKTYDGYLKLRLLQQSSGAQQMPISLALFASTAINTIKYSEAEREFQHRLTYTYQALLARKFSEAFSLQIVPTMIHRNLVATRNDENNVYAIGAAGRYKLSKRVSINAEYFYLLPGETADNQYNSLSLGVDIETGGHVFQLHITNSQGMIEKFFIPQTAGDWGNGDLYFGFNISRAFQLGKNKIEKNW
ncbi:MAG: DUF5777 family beta-barrel protein [Saprospiraceae bacterium]|nr:DUF5777 family beta-barrel protein [Saprospiraceae bacterium]